MVLGKLEYLISVNNSKLSSGLSAAEGKVKGFGNKISTWAVAKGQILGRMIEKAGQATMQFVSDSVSESMAFDKSMAQVAATLGKTTGEVQDLAKFARKMGSETAFTAQEAAEGLNYMALAGYDAETSMKMLPQVLNLAAAGNFDLARASDMVTDAQSALGLSVEDTEVMIDQMAKTASKTNTSVEQLGDAMLTVGGTAKQLKGGTKELSTVLGVLADNGIKGSEGGTALRNVLLRLTAPTDKAAKELKSLGVDAFDSEGNLKNLSEIFLDFNKAMTGKTQQERAAAFSEIFNVRDLKAVEALLGTSADRWDELYEAIGGSKGAAAQMAETQLDNLAGDVTKMKSALGEAKLSIVEGLTPSLRRLTQVGTKAIQRLTNAFKERGLKGAIEEGKTMFKDFVTNLKNSEDPAVRAVGKIASIFTEGLSWDTLKDAISGAWDTVIAGFNGLGKIIFGENADGTTKWPTWDDVGTFVTNAWDTIKVGFNGLGKLIFGENADGTTKWPTWDDVKSYVETAWTGIKTGFTSLGKLVFGENVDGTIKWPTWDDVQAAADTAWKTIETGLGSLCQWALGTPEMPSMHDVGLAINKWWRETIEPFLDGIYNFLLGSPGMEDSDGNKTLEMLKSWWDNIIAPALKGILDFTLGLFGLPSVDDMVEKIEKWWADVKAKVGNLVLNITTNFTGDNGAGGGSPSSGTGTPYNQDPTSQDTWSTPWWASMPSFMGHAKGLWDVPYDNYPALLHRDETVLTASQARKYKNGDDINYYTIGEMVGSTVKAALKDLNVYMYGDKVGDMTSRRVDKNIRATSYSKLRAMGG